jgi:hypothetical protein
MIVKICTSCKKTVTRIRAGEVGGRAIFTDEHAKRWEGTRCPTCRLGIRRKYAAKAAAVADVQTHFEPNPQTRRTCRVCRKRLPTSNYFYHNECAPTDDTYGIDDYGGYCNGDLGSGNVWAGKVSRL